MQTDAPTQTMNRQVRRFYDPDIDALGLGPEPWKDYGPKTIADAVKLHASTMDSHGVPLEVRDERSPGRIWVLTVDFETRLVVRGLRGKE